MPRRTVLCAGTCGRQLQVGKGSLPEGQAMCRPCRAERRGKPGMPRIRPPRDESPDLETLTCAVCERVFPFARSMDGSRAPRRTCSEDCRRVLAGINGANTAATRRPRQDTSYRAHPCPGGCGETVVGPHNAKCADCRRTTQLEGMRRRNRSRPQRQARAAAHAQRTCATCDGPMGDVRRQKYCSDDCARAAKPAPLRECATCGNQFSVAGQRKTCSAACAAEAKRRYAVKYNERRPRSDWDRSDRTCSNSRCGETFAPTWPGQAYCNKKCGANARRRRERAHGTRHRDVHRERAQRYGREWEPIDPERVFERDGWRCQIPECDQRVRKLRRDVDYLHPLSPTLDHIIPMSVPGGDHVYANVRAGHRTCNERRGNRIGVEQLALIG